MRPALSMTPIAESARKPRQSLMPQPGVTDAGPARRWRPGRSIARGHEAHRDQGQGGDRDPDQAIAHGRGAPAESRDHQGGAHRHRDLAEVAREVVDAERGAPAFFRESGGDHGRVQRVLGPEPAPAIRSRSGEVAKPPAVPSAMKPRPVMTVPITSSERSPSRSASRPAGTWVAASAPE